MRSNGEYILMDTITLKADSGFDEVMEFYAPMVYRIAFARLGNRSDAEDISQDVFLRYFKAQPAFDTEEHRKAWLIRCTVNCTKNLAASAWFRHRASDAGLENMAEEEYETGFSDTTADCTEQTLRRSAIMDAVMSLPEKYRTVIHLFYFEDMPINEICEALGQKENTIKSRLSRARDMLKTILKEVDF